MSQIDSRLAELGIELPPLLAPVGNYLPCSGRLAALRRRTRPGQRR